MIKQVKVSRKDRACTLDPDIKLNLFYGKVTLLSYIDKTS